MADREFPNSGAMFAREKRNERASDFGGQFTLDGDVLDYVLRCAERGDKVELEISAWKRRTTNSGTMLGLKIELPYKERGGGQRQQSRGTYRSGGGGSYQSRSQDSGRRDMRREMNDDFPEEVQRGPRRIAPSRNSDPWDD